MVSIHRENQGSSEFETSFSEHPDGWRCTVQRGGTVSLSGGPFKTLASAHVWARQVVRQSLQHEIDEAGAGVAQELDFGADEALEGERLCRCGHRDGEHEVLDGPCSGWAGAPCPCDAFELAAYEAPRVTRMGSLQTTLEQSGTSPMPAGVPPEVLR